MQSSGKNGGGGRPDLPRVMEGTQQWGHPLDRPDPLNETDVKLDETAQALIGHHLKSLYSKIVKQPIPDQFLVLLDELERKEGEH